MCPCRTSTEWIRGSQLAMVALKVLLESVNPLGTHELEQGVHSHHAVIWRRMHEA